jgi:hypothetical protein
MTQATGSQPYEIRAVGSYGELLAAIDCIPCSLGSHRVFRGQRQDYNRRMVVSSARKYSEAEEFRRVFDWLSAIEVLQMISRTRGTGFEAPRTFPAEFQGANASPAWGEGVITGVKGLPLSHPELDRQTVLVAAIMQHYGATSDFLDCTSSLDVAIWFSHHELCSEQLGGRVEDWYGKWYELHHDFFWYKAVTNDTGIIYVFDVQPLADSLEDGLLADLGHMDVGLRPRFQSAAMIYANPRGDAAGDLAQFVRIAFEVPVPLPGAPQEQLAKRTTDLFQRPESDGFYDYLLRQPFYTRSPQEPNKLSRMITIPYYINAETDWQSESCVSPYLTRCGQINPSWIFADRFELANILYPDRDAEARSLSQALQAADAWVLAGPTSKLIAIDSPEFGTPEKVGEINLCLEFSPFESLGIPPGTSDRDFCIAFRGEAGEKIAMHRLPQCADLRGVWLHRGHNEGHLGYWFQAFFGWLPHSQRHTSQLFFIWDPKQGPSYVGSMPHSKPLAVHTFLVWYVIGLVLAQRSGIYRLEAFPKKSVGSPYKMVRYKVEPE